MKLNILMIEIIPFFKVNILDENETKVIFNISALTYQTETKLFNIRRIETSKGLVIVFLIVLFFLHRLRFSNRFGIGIKIRIR